MTFNITNWNVNPNREWYFRMSDQGGKISGELFLDSGLTQRQAYGEADYGSASNMILVNETHMSGETQVEYFQSAFTKHAVVAGESGDPNRTFRLAEFVDLPEISDPIFRNTDLIEIKATAEIDAHTHAVIERDVELATHLQDLDVGDIVRLTITQANIDEYVQVSSHTIKAEKNSIISKLRLTRFMSFTR